MGDGLKRARAAARATTIDPRKPCRNAARYKGTRPPRCNNGFGCDACRTIYNAAQAAKRWGP